MFRFLSLFALMAATQAAPIVVSLENEEATEQVCTTSGSCVAGGGVDPAFIKTVKTILFSDKDDNKAKNKLLSRRITQTTPSHIDKVRRTGETVRNPVAFVMMNTNEDAYFSHGTTDIVNVEEGNLVIFDGDVPHNTVVKSGIVELLGPFDTVTFDPVGVLGPPPTSCPGQIVGDGDIFSCDPEECVIYLALQPVEDDPLDDGDDDDDDGRRGKKGACEPLEAVLFCVDPLTVDCENDLTINCLTTGMPLP